jgi:tetratricopeptide (TPR) repeat protein
MATKEVMVSAPLMVILWDRFFAPDRGRQALPLYAALASTWLILGVLVASGARSASAGFGFEAWPWWRYLLTQAEVLIHYLRLALYPSPLVLDYDWPAVSSWTRVVLPGAFVLVLLGATVIGVFQRYPAAFAGAWFFLILAPTSSVLPIVTEVAAEHRMYLPLASLTTLAVIAGFRLLPRILARVALVTAVLLFGSMTQRRNEDYADFDRIWLDTIAKRPDNARARNNYATSLLTQGRFADAEVHLRVAVARNRSFAEAEANLGAALSAQRKLDEGAAHLERALVLRPEFAEASRNLGENYAMRGLMREAVSAYGEALDRLPDDVRLLNRIGWILATSGNDEVRDGARARSLAERAVALTEGRDPLSLDTLGAALAEVGAFEQAHAITLRALSLAVQQGNPQLERDLRLRLGRYSAGQPFRETEAK